jgi:hypothetical protein
MDITVTLTEEDFNLINSALEYYPEKESAGLFMVSMLDAMLADKTPEGRERLKQKQDQQNRKALAERDRILEDVRVLQGKIIQLKRQMLTDNALRQANDELIK